MAKEKEEVAKTRMGKLDTHLSSLWVIAALFIAVFVTICIYVYAGEQKDLPQRHFGDVEINGELSGPGQLFTRKADTYVQTHDKGTTGGTCWILTQPANTTLTEILLTNVSDTAFGTNASGYIEVDITNSNGTEILGGTSIVSFGSSLGPHTTIKSALGFGDLFSGTTNDYLGTSIERKIHVNITNVDQALIGSSPRLGLAGQFFQDY